MYRQLVLVNIPGWYSFEVTGGGKTIIELVKVFHNKNTDVLILGPSNWKDYEINKKSFTKKLKYLRLVNTPESLRFLLFPSIMLIRIIQIILKYFKLIHININDHERIIILVHNDIISTLLSLVIKVFYRHKRIFIIFPYYHVYPDLLKGGLGGVLTYLSLKLMKYADIIYTESSYVAMILENNYEIEQKKIFVAGVGINNNQYEIYRNLYKERKTYDACFVGRIHPGKGIYDLVRAWKIVVNVLPNSKLAIVGKGLSIYEKHLRKMIRDLNLQCNVHFLGFLPEDQKIRTICSSKILIHPSYGECIPLVFLEAMACETLIITYYLPTYVDIKDRIIPVKVGNIEDLASKIINVLNGNLSIDTITKFGREYAQNNDWSIIVKKMLSRLK